MKKNNIDSSSAGSWYSKDGKDNDVVLSTRVRLARNLANFPFPSHFRGDDASRVQTLVFDSFSKVEDPDSYQTVALKSIDDSGIKILTERGLIDDHPGSGIVMGSEDDLFCLVNSKDHLRIASFVTGFDCKASYEICRSLDDQLQKSLQFAASYEFGFLTSSVSDVGSGMKISVRLHLPSLSYAGKIPEISSSLQKNGCVFSACFGSSSSFSSALGAYYEVSTSSSFTGNEFDQIFSLASSIVNLVETERKFTREYAENIPTAVRDIISRSYATVKFSRLITNREAVEIISNIKWAVNLKLLTGIENRELCALLYRTRDGHVQFVLKNGNFKFEKDIESDIKLKTDRLRAIILQGSFENILFADS